MFLATSPALSISVTEISVGYHISSQRGKGIQPCPGHALHFCRNKIVINPIHKYSYRCSDSDSSHSCEKFCWPDDYHNLPRNCKWTSSVLDYSARFFVIATVGGTREYYVLPQTNSHVSVRPSTSMPLTPHHDISITDLIFIFVIFWSHFNSITKIYTRPPAPEEEETRARDLTCPGCPGCPVPPCFHRFDGLCLPAALLCHQTTCLNTVCSLNSLYRLHNIFTNSIPSYEEDVHCHPAQNSRPHDKHQFPTSLLQMRIHA